MKIDWRQFLSITGWLFVIHLVLLIIAYQEFNDTLRLAKDSISLVLTPQFAHLTFLLGWLSYPVSKLSHFVSTNELVSEVQFLLVLLNSLLWAVVLATCLQITSILLAYKDASRKRGRGSRKR